MCVFRIALTLSLATSVSGYFLSQRAGTTSWPDALASTRSAQTELWMAAEGWAKSQQGFNQEWTTMLEAGHTHHTEAFVLATNNLKSVGQQLQAGCPVSCKMDAMQAMDWQATADYKLLNKQATEFKKQIANHKADAGNIEVLVQRVSDFTLKTNKLTFTAAQELERFEIKIAQDIEPKIGAAAVLAQVAEPAMPTEEQLLAPYSIKKGIIQNAIAYCKTFADFVDNRNDLHGDMAAKHDAAVQDHQNTQSKIASNATAWASKQGAFEDLVKNFYGICGREVTEFAREDALVGKLQPAELAHAFGAESDNHHDWWSKTCKNIESSATMITSWMASRQITFLNGQEAAAERILAAGDRPVLAAAPEKTSQWCAQDWQAQLSDVDAKIEEMKR